MKKNWSNTVLVAYSLIPKIIKELNFGVKTRVNSTFQSRHLKYGIGNEQLIGEILELTDEKRKLVNLRYIVNFGLSDIDEKNRKLLKARIVDKKTYQTIADENGISLRTVFRRIGAAENSYALALRRAGYSESWFEKQYGSDKYIAPIRERILNDKYFVAKNL